MPEHSRYQSSAKEAEMVGEVLKNKPGLTNQTELTDAEAFYFDRAYRYFIISEPTESFAFNVAMLFLIHQKLFESLYTWAGKIRTVNISKGNAMFCSANYIDSALADFNLVLRNNIPDLIAACIAGMNQEYELMSSVIQAGLTKTKKT